MRLVVCTEEEKRSVLMECHNSGTGNHNGVRGTRDRVIAGYFWPTLMKDVTEWVKCCRRCQLNDPMKTGTPVLHSIKVKAAWEVIGLDLIGPLRETGQKNKYVLTMTDLYTKWVVAEPLQNKTATEVSAAIIKTLYLFGMVKKIITDQGREFVNELNENIFATLKIKHAVSSAYHPQTNGQDERTNQNVKRVLRKYVNESHNDWDIHLPAVVYGINTAKQSSTRHTPYFLFFHRHPHLPEVMNACPMGEDFKIADPEDDLDTRVNEMKILNEKVLSNIENAQKRQQKSYRNRKRKLMSTISPGDEVLISQDFNIKQRKDTLADRHKGPFTVDSISKKGVASVVKDNGTRCCINVSRLRPFYRLENHGAVPCVSLQDHEYGTPDEATDHPYAFSGEKWEKDLGPLQEKLLKYVLDKSLPAAELIVKDDNICLTREDLWSLGLNQCMESTIGNACFKIIREAAQKHGKDVYIADMYVVPTWKTMNVDPLSSLPNNLCSKDAILFPAWSMQQNQLDHYLLCVELQFQKIDIQIFRMKFVD
ncbi:gypsy retrotransposon integrase-like protein 1 [Astyanax mexicanus]|uniref:gypsy retrotransposon integrase-like protein 1 n=1 Tax=Astyanax mexicanus TaxID=7994 RepID=UPI0020CB6883|nr:gypsy retrotransposon integrase-like protein 1 [Astyanax mexicanus]